MTLIQATHADNIILIVRIASILCALGFACAVWRALLIIHRRDAAQRDIGGF